MMLFEFICDNGHAFEAWFKDHAALEDQFDEGLIQCPVCESGQVTQTLATGGVVKGRTEGADPLTASPGSRAFLRALKSVIETNFENVGPEFAKTALKIHYGVEEPRNIRGTTTAEEEKVLNDDGVEFFSIPVPDIPEDSELN